jgi:hypothetical protein
VICFTNPNPFSLVVFSFNHHVEGFVQEEEEEEEGRKQ